MESLDWQELQQQLEEDHREKRFVNLTLAWLAISLMLIVLAGKIPKGTIFRHKPPATQSHLQK